MWILYVLNFLNIKIQAKKLIPGQLFFNIRSSKLFFLFTPLILPRAKIERITSGVESVNTEENGVFIIFFQKEKRALKQIERKKRIQKSFALNVLQFAALCAFGNPTSFFASTWQIWEFKKIDTLYQLSKINELFLWVVKKYLEPKISPFG